MALLLVRTLRQTRQFVPPGIFNFSRLFEKLVPIGIIPQLRRVRRYCSDVQSLGIDLRESRAIDNWLEDPDV